MTKFQSDIFIRFEMTAIKLMFNPYWIVRMALVRDAAIEFRALPDQLGSLVYVARLTLVRLFYLNTAVSYFPTNIVGTYYNL